MNSKIGIDRDLGILPKCHNTIPNPHTGPRLPKALNPMDVIVTLQCPDQAGIVHSMTTAILSCGGNIVENQQFTDPATNIFVMRTRFETSQSLEETTNALNSELSRFAPKLKIRLAQDKPKVLLMITTESHCLRDLLYLYELGELKVTIPIIISNHTDLKELVESHGIRFLHMPITKETKLDQESAMEEIMKELEIDFVVLARYMQILSNAKPYHQAHARGVKIIGATAHFVTGTFRNFMSPV
jgi:formyltetrahydrofolate deformylase